MKNDYFVGLDRLILIVLVPIVFMSFPANLLRLSGVHFFQSNYFTLIFLSYFPLAFLCLVAALRVRVAEPVFAPLMLTFCVWIFAIGVSRGNDDPIGAMRYFVLPLLIYVMLLGRRYVLFFYTSKWLWVAILITHILGLLYYFSNLSGYIYPGIGVQNIAYAAIYFFSNGHPALFLASIVAIVLEGKRSVLLSLLVTLLFIRLFKFKSNILLLGYFVAAVLLSLIVISTILFFLASIEGSVVVNRINLINPFSYNYDLFKGSSGRWGELVTFFGERNFVDTLIGAGAGFNYEWELGYSSEREGEVKSYFHMSAANYVAAGGIVGAVTFLYLLKIPMDVRRLKMPDNVRRTAFGLALMSVVQSFLDLPLPLMRYL